MTTLTINDLYGAIRGLGNPITGVSTSDFMREATNPPAPPSSGEQAVCFGADGWLQKTIVYRHNCMVNLGAVNKQLTDGKLLTNRALILARKAFLCREINVCHRMLSTFSKDID